MATVRGRRRRQGIRALWLTVGVVVGAVAGILTGDLSLWLTLGAIAGFVVGLLASRR